MAHIPALLNLFWLRPFWFYTYSCSNLASILNSTWSLLFAIEVGPYKNMDTIITIKCRHTKRLNERDFVIVADVECEENGDNVED